jgi:Na+-translocating ferredoxin:NAD+ oxidoreductase RnfC subunit
LTDCDSAVKSSSPQTSSSTTVSGNPVAESCNYQAHTVHISNTGV